MSDHGKRHIRKWIIEILEETPKGDNYVQRRLMVHKQGSHTVLVNGYLTSLNLVVQFIPTFKCSNLLHLCHIVYFCANIVPFKTTGISVCPHSIIPHILKASLNYTVS